MSRIGKLPISVPGGVTITVDDGNTVTVKGPKGTLSEKISPDMEIEQDNGVLHVKRPSDDKRHRALHGLTRSLIHNMVVGVTEGFAKNLEIEGVGYRAQLQGSKLVLNINAPEGITFEVPAPNRIVVKGASKQQVGQMAADIRAVREPEPYKGKGIRYAGEHVRRKEGKTGK